MKEVPGVMALESNASSGSSTPSLLIVNIPHSHLHVFGHQYLRVISTSESPGTLLIHLGTRGDTWHDSGYQEYIPSTARYISLVGLTNLKISSMYLNILGNSLAISSLPRSCASSGWVHLCMMPFMSRYRLSVVMACACIHTDHGDPGVSTQCLVGKRPALTNPSHEDTLPVNTSQ